ncbi:MAG: transposase [Candidatus Obscuribacter sp.]|nr:transposase [Candidatus Obscuribacter sp.]
MSSTSRSKGPDTRFVVTNATSMTARKIYQDKYCSRAQCENWIKDLKVYLKSGRTSCQEFGSEPIQTDAPYLRLHSDVFHPRSALSCGK